MLNPGEVGGDAEIVTVTAHSSASTSVTVSSRSGSAHGSGTQWVHAVTAADFNRMGFDGTLEGNADTATALETARTIGGVSFDGTANINLPGVNTAGNQDTSGNAATATALETARTIGGVSFNGTANINLPGVNTAGNQDTSGNAATATLAADSSLLGGLGLKGSSSAPSGSQVIRSHTNGYTYLGWINTPSGSTTSTVTRIYASNDNFVRYVTPATFRSQVTDPHYLLNTTDTLSGKLTITGDMVADDVQATTGVFYGGGSDTSQPNEYMQFSESGNWWRVVNDGGEDFRVTSSGYAQTQGRRYYFGIGSNDYIYHDDANNEFDFVSDGTHRMRLGESVLLDRSNSSFWSLSPPTGTGNDAEWSAAFGYYYLRRNSSTAAEKVNIQTDLEGWLTPEMIDSVVPKMWARTATPDYPEIGPIAEDMDAISPFLGTKGTDADGEVFLNGIDRNAYLSLLVLAVKDLRARVAELEAG